MELIIISVIGALGVGKSFLFEKLANLLKENQKTYKNLS